MGVIHGWATASPAIDTAGEAAESLELEGG